MESEKRLAYGEKLQKWGEGPWLDEPDHVEFEHKGVPCIVHRNALGVWCGYAAVNPGHPWHGKHYAGEWDEGSEGPEEPVPARHVDVHGGLTYADKCQGDVCHVAKPGEPDDVWWFGFDAAHAWDLCPAMSKLRRDHDMESPNFDMYRDYVYMREETKRLAEQLLAAAGSGL